MAGSVATIQWSDLTHVGALGVGIVLGSYISVRIMKYVMEYLTKKDD